MPAANLVSLDAIRQDSSRRCLIFALAIVALTIPAAYFNGIVLQRWGDSTELTDDVRLLEKIATDVGEWTLVGEGEPIEDYLIDELEVRGYCHRIYEHRVTGQRVALLLLVGPAGPLLRHPPEVCYQTRANALLSNRLLNIQADRQAARMRLLVYESASVVDGDFFVAYGFGSDGTWDVPESPRVAYGGKPTLLKLHVLTEMAEEKDRERPAGLIDFLEQMLPHLAKQLM